MSGLFDFPYETIDRYYLLYTVPLWIFYFIIVVRILTKCIKIHFHALIAMNGIADLLLCVFGNLFYRWPQTFVFYDGLYKNLQTYSSFLSFFCFLRFHLSYAVFLSTLFMSFNSICTLAIPKLYPLFWDHSFYKYVMTFIIVPTLLFINVLFSESRFDYVSDSQPFRLITLSYIPQYISREVGTAMLSVLLDATILLYCFSVVMIFLRAFKKFEHKLERYQVEEAIIGIFYTCLRGLFLYYEIKVGWFAQSNDRASLYRANSMFPFFNDVISLTPSIVVVASSSKIRQLLFPFIALKQNRVHFNENANEVHNVEEREPAPIPAELPVIPEKDESPPVEEPKTDVNKEK